MASRMRTARYGLTQDWVLTAPTPARTKGQIEPTAGTAEATATPNSPVEAQRATMEKVFASILLVGLIGLAPPLQMRKCRSSVAAVSAWATSPCSTISPIFRIA